MFGDVFGNRLGEGVLNDDGEESQISWDPLREPTMRPGGREAKYGESRHAYRIREGNLKSITSQIGVYGSRIYVGLFLYRN
jgi:hypothetical protein